MVTAESRVRSAIIAPSFFLPILILAILSLSACFPWSTPNEQPMFLSLKGGKMSFAWCGDQTESFQRLVIDAAIYSPTRSDVSVVEALGEFSLTPAARFSVDELPRGLEVVKSGELPVLDHRTTIFVNTGRGVKDLNGIRASFSLDSASRFADSGNWISPDGRESSEPCV